MVAYYNIAALVPVPLSSFAGETTSFMGKSFLKSYVGVCMEGAAVGIYFGLKNYIDKETVSWLCIVVAAPIAIAGFFKYNGMNFEEFAKAWLLVFF